MSEEGFKSRSLGERVLQAWIALEYKVPLEEVTDEFVEKETEKANETIRLYQGEDTSKLPTKADHEAQQYPKHP